MKAVVCSAFGPPSQLTIEDLPTPKPGLGQVRIEVHAAGCNFPDYLIVEGLYQFKPPFPFSPGGEVAGIVAECGENVTDLVVGDRVVATMLWGGYAEEVIVDAAAVAKLPEPFGFKEAAGLVLTYATTLYALKDRGALQAGETLLVLGASGGVGTAAIQIGKALGARVIAAASSPEKLEMCTALGADAVIDYQREDLKQQAKALTGGHGADVVYDPVGGDYAEPALRAIGWGGRFLVIGFASGKIPQIPLNLALLKGCAIVGVFWGSFMMREPDQHQANVRALFDMWARREIAPAVSKVYRLDEASLALEDLKGRRAQGKLVIEIRPKAPSGEF